MVLVLAQSWLFYMIGTSLPQVFLSVLWLILVNLTLESPFYRLCSTRLGSNISYHTFFKQDKWQLFKKIASSCTMFPLRLSYAWTIWKVQGQTLSSNFICNLGDTEKEDGLSYTVFSRATGCSLLRISSGIPFDCLIVSQKNRLKEELRLAKKSKKTSLYLKKNPFQMPTIHSNQQDLALSSLPENIMPIHTNQDSPLSSLPANADAIMPLPPIATPLQTKSRKRNSHTRNRFCPCKKLKCKYEDTAFQEVISSFSPNFEDIIVSTKVRNHDITGKDIQTLRDGSWVNDVIVNDFLSSCPLPIKIP